jgi:hypothetical protein
MVTTDLWLVVILLAVAVFTGVPSGYYDYHVTAVIVAYCGTHVSSGHGFQRGVTSGHNELADTVSDICSAH